MLYHLFQFLETEYDLPGAGLFQYISFRAGMAIIVSLVISMIFGGHIIRFLKRKQVGEPVRNLGLVGERQKEGTPTMGGIIIILATLIPCILFARLDNVYTLIMIGVTIWMATIGFIDDYIKVFKKNKAGLKGKFKIAGQVTLGLVVGIIMLNNRDIVIRIDPQTAENLDYEIIETVQTRGVDGDQKEMVYVKTSLTNVPFFKGNRLDYARLIGFLGPIHKKYVWILFLPLVILVVTAVSNASNLTDGLDGLATGISAIIGGTLGVMAYVSGHTIFADYLNILYIPYSSELLVFSACFLGGCIGFLWYNAYPAKVFMGDMGSLTIGGVIASMAILLRKELLIPILCGVFLMESLSVILQVSYFKFTKRRFGAGKRIFRMAPLHHHYQMKGMHEAKIVARFWIVGMLLAVFTVITLKIR